MEAPAWSSVMATDSNCKETSWPSQLYKDFSESANVAVGVVVYLSAAGSCMSLTAEHATKYSKRALDLTGPSQALCHLL
jgi:hypothetical protein